MNIKSRNGYAEGGFLDDGASVDPISGNEVPTGSLKEEVRDDVSTQLSEGEFVVPADVVRFIGLDKLMKMREQAKTGLARMEEEGQIGGSPAMEEPLPSEMDSVDDDDLEMDALIDGLDGGDFEGSIQRFAEGGSVRPSYETYTGRKFNENTVVEWTKYVNAAGDVRMIKTVKGQPLTEVPEGYYVDGSEPTEGSVSGGTESTVAPVQGGGDGGDSLVNEAGNPWKDIYSLSSSDANKQQHQNASTRVTRDRQVALKDLAEQFKDEPSGTMVTKQMQNYMTADALDILNTRGSSTTGLDGYFLKDMTPAEKAVWAQKTADSQGLGKPDPAYTGKSTGVTPSISGIFNDVIGGISSLAEGITAVDVIATLLGVPTVVTAVLKESLKETAESGKVPPKDIPIIEAVDEDAATVTKESTVQPTTGGKNKGIVGTATGSAVLDSSGNPIRFGATEVTSESVGVDLSNIVSRTPEVEVDPFKAETIVSNATTKPLTSSSIGDVTTTGLPVQDVNGVTTTGIPSPNIITEAESDLMTSLSGATTASTGASLGNTGVVGTTSNVATTGSITEALTKESVNTANVDSITEIAKANGVDPQEAVDAWNNSGNVGTLAQAVVNISNNNKEAIEKAATDTAYANAQMVKQEAIQAAYAKAAADKAAADKAASDAAALSLLEQQRMQQYQTNTGGGDGEGDRQRNAAGGTGGGVRSSSGQSGYRGSSVGEAGRYKGGLIQKMRSDNTSGLASKKKAKQKAKAKKGALAAKRT
jgi:hypothetical protein